MAIFESVFDMVGNTPLFHIPIKGTRCDLYLKLEKFNPGQSVKDRAARNMILQAEKLGRLRPGDTIIESSSGNTGISLAMLAASRGYRFICIVDNHVAQEKIEILKAYGAIVKRVGVNLPPNYHAAKERVEMVKELCETNPDAFFIDQGANLDNGEAHYTTTAEELLAELGLVNYLFASVGTGGSISGTGRRLKEKNPETVVVGIEPTGSVIFGNPYKPFFQSGTGSACLIFKNVDFLVINENYQVTDKQAFNTCRYLARYWGLLVGGSSGAVIFKAIEYITTKPCEGVVVALIPDGGERYLSTIFNDEWMKNNQLLDDGVSSFLLQRLELPPLRSE